MEQTFNGLFAAFITASKSIDGSGTFDKTARLIAIFPGQENDIDIQSIENLRPNGAYCMAVFKGTIKEILACDPFSIDLFLDRPQAV